MRVSTEAETKFNWNWTRGAFSPADRRVVDLARAETSFGGCGGIWLRAPFKVLQRDWHINVQRKGSHVAGSLRSLVLGPPDRWSDVHTVHKPPKPWAMSEKKRKTLSRVSDRGTMKRWDSLTVMMLRRSCLSEGRWNISLLELLIVLWLRGSGAATWRLHFL